MFSLIFIALCSFALSLILTPLCRNFALARGWVDHPNPRKLHRKPVPRLGGVPIFLAFLLSCAAVFATGSGGSKLLDKNLALILELLPAVAVVFAIGLADDIRGLEPWQKLAGQAFAALLACASGVLIKGLAGVLLPHWVAWPLTVFWLVACANAVNLIDGVDGVASGVALFATLTVFLAASFGGYYSLQFATVPLLAALLGFLRYNFNPASIFLGDCGSLTLGFLLGCYGASCGRRSPRPSWE